MTLNRPGPSELPVAPPPNAFHFGRNWQRYVSAHLDPDRERIAAASLSALVGDLSGKTFVDVGCGSGLFSLCAYRSGASSIVSFDVDPDAVKATHDLHRRAGSPTNWRVIHRSILDPATVADLEPADVVYSWGVLHHTGDMYGAIRNAAALVKRGGRFAIAIYNNDTDRWVTSRRWRHIKRAYNHAPRGLQVGMELLYGLYWLAGCIYHLQDPFRAAREYRQSRGMAVWTDLVDWLGGYPYEFAKAREIIDFCETACGLVCRSIVPEPADGIGNNEFLFERPLE